MQDTSHHPPNASPTLARGNVLLVCVMAGLGLASMFIVLAVLARSITYRVTAQLVVPSDRAQLCEELIGSSEEIAYEKVMMTSTVAMIRLECNTSDPLKAHAEMDALAANVLERVSAMTQSRPAIYPETQILETQLRELDQQLAAMAASQRSDPPSPPLAKGGNQDKSPLAKGGNEGVDLLSSVWQQQINTRQSFATQLKQLDEKMAVKPPDEAGIAPDPIVVSAAQAGDQKLQADLQALKDRESRLSQLLDAVLDRGEPELERFSVAVTTADKLVAEHAEEEQQSADLAAALAAIRRHLTEWQKTAAEFGEYWLKQHVALAASDSDPLSVQALLEPAAKSFLADAETSKTALGKALESIGESSDQPTKRLVLRNTLSQQLEESMDAHQLLAAAARSVILLENRELSAITETVTGSRVKCHQQQDQIVATLRQEALAKLRGQYQAELVAAQTERAQLLTRAAEIDAALLQTGRQLLDAVQYERDRQGELVQVRDLHRRRADVLARWLALSTEQQRQLLATPPSVTPFFIPATATPLLPSKQGLVRAFLLGAAPLAASMLLWLMIALPAALKRSRQARTEYAQLLQTASEDKDRTTVHPR